MIKFTTHTLPNGLRVLLAPMKETQAVTVLFAFGVGSRYESKAQNGLAHFLEHMFFKGTTKRPTTLDISQELDALGAEFNAFTSEEVTAYYVSAAAESFPVAFDVLTDMLYDSLFNSAEIEKEKGVICEEIKMYHDNPMSYLDEVSKGLIFGDSPLGRDVAGLAATVTKFTRQSFVDYKNQHYGPNNTVLVIAGNPKHHDWLSLASSLSHLKTQPTPEYKAQKEIGSPAEVKIGHKAIDQSHLSLMHYGLKHQDERIYAQHVLSNILGGTMSSRLFVEVREKRGLAYYVRSSADSFRDTGVFACSAGVDTKKLPEAIAVIMAETNRLKAEPVTDLELTRAKQNIRGRISLRFEDSYSIARYLADESLFYPVIEQPEEYIEKIEKITKEDILKLANELLVPAKRKLAVVGPLKTEDGKELAKLIDA